MSLLLLLLSISAGADDDWQISLVGWQLGGVHLAADDGRLRQRTAE